MPRQLSSEEFVNLTSGAHPLKVTRHVRARRYLLRLTRDGVVRLTIPRTGSMERGRTFLQANIHWLERAFARLSLRPSVPKVWRLGTEIFWRGERVTLQLAAEGMDYSFGNERLPKGSADSDGDLRPGIERYMRKVALLELPEIVRVYAGQHGLAHLVQRVTIRNQRSRWGSCSRRGTISLNWRLVQAPNLVRDYLVLHELMHLRQMNHSPRFWAEVEAVCPAYATAERWLNEHAFILH